MSTGVIEQNVTIPGLRHFSNIGEIRPCSGAYRLFPGEGRGPFATSFERLTCLTNSAETGPRPSPGN